MDVPEKGRVRLHFAHGACSLCHDLTAERVSLDASQRWPKLAFDDEGFGEITMAGATTSTSQFFAGRLVQDSDLGLVILIGDTACELNDYLNRNELFQVPLQSSGLEAVVSTYIFSNCQCDGFRVWWGLSTLYEVAEGADKKPGAWLANWTRHWHKRLTKLGLRRPHLRPSEKSDASQGVVYEVGEDSVDARCLPETAASTPAMLLLLSRLGATKTQGADKRELAAVRWRAIWGCILAQFLPAQAVLAFCLSKKWTPQTGCCTNAWVAVPLTDGTLDPSRAEGLGGSVHTLMVALGPKRISLVDAFARLDRIATAHLAA